MTLPESYRRVKQSIVAIVLKYELLKEGDPPPEMMPILGTGFIVDDGLIVTNDHIIQQIDHQPKPPNAPADEWPVMCVMFVELNENDQAMIPLNILGKMVITSHDPQGSWYGQKTPDIGFIRVKAKGLPVLPLNTDWRILQEGMQLATAGFPLGRDTLIAPGYLHHIGPTLKAGVLGALLPFPRTRPHAFILNVMSQGGQSGSPIFHPETGDVVGILYGGLEEPAQTKLIKDIYMRPTAITYGLPAGLIQAGIEVAKKHPDYALPEDTLSLQQMIDTYPRDVSTGPIRDTEGKKLSTDRISILQQKQQ
jgi:S1-C subfamily serine protease